MVYAFSISAALMFVEPLTGALQDRSRFQTTQIVQWFYFRNTLLAEVEEEIQLHVVALDQWNCALSAIKFRRTFLLIWNQAETPVSTQAFHLFPTKFFVSGMSDKISNLLSFL